MRVTCVWAWAWTAWLCSLAAAHSHYRPLLHPALAPADSQEDEDGGRSGHLALQLRGNEVQAKHLASKYHLHYIRQVFVEPPMFHLHLPDAPGTGRHRRETRHDFDLLQELSREPGVQWVDRQQSFFRDKRHNSPGSSIMKTKASRLSHHIEGEVRRSRAALEALMRQYTLARSSTRDHTVNMNVQNEGKEDIKRVLDYWRSEESLGVDKLQEIRKPITASINSDIRAQLNADNTLNTRKNKINKSTTVNNPVFPAGHLYSLRGVSTPYTSLEETNEKDRFKENKMFSEEKLMFNDPYYRDQWYLHDTGQQGLEGERDLNVMWAWHRGFTGRGVLISVLDDGIQTTNDDLRDNYEAAVSYNIVRDGRAPDDPSPRLDATFSNSHGTYCAAVAAAVADNGVCGVGVAYEARVGGVRIVDGPVTDIQEATALSRYSDKVDVFSSSWGPSDNGKKVEGPGKLAQQALREGVTKGRGGLGVIYVWASGNGGFFGDNCNCDGYTSSIFTLSVSSVTPTGASAFYSERCASTLAGVYVGGKHSTKDINFNNLNKHLNVVVPELDGHCSHMFQGSSAAAPLMAGVVALVLQANPGLTWRDMQHLTVAAANPTPQALKEDGWATNAKGKRFHLLQGFGAVDAGKMVDLATTWTNVGPQQIKTLPSVHLGSLPLPPQGWLNRSVEFSAETGASVEHVVANMSLEHPHRGSLSAFIISPSGTTSQVLTRRRADNSAEGFKSWGFMSVQFWGEDPRGTWTVALQDGSDQQGRLTSLHLTVYYYVL